MNTNYGKGVWFWREPTFLFDCPCQRKPPGCVNYECIEKDPFYLCAFTEFVAYIPKHSTGHGFE